MNLGYSYFHRNAGVEPGAAPVNDPSSLGNDPRHSVFIHLAANLGQSVVVNRSLRGVGSLPAPAVPGYLTFDLRTGWRIKPNLEWSVAGRDLGAKQHPEFGANTPRREEIPRSAYTQIEWTF
jgi:iron complex outermembrane recepter protein